MLKGVARRRRKKKRRDEEGRGSTPPPPDTIADPLRERTTDPLQAETMRADALSSPEEEVLSAPDSEIEHPLDEELTELHEAMEELEIEESPADLDEEEIEDIVIAAELEIEPVEVDEHEEILEDLLDLSSLHHEELELEDVAEEDLEVEEIDDLLEIDRLGRLMSELRTVEALDDESPVVEAIIDEELDAAVEDNTNGFANVFVTPRDMVANEIQSLHRPNDDADTLMQVTPMSWVPNIIKVPVGRIAMDVRPLDRALNHHIKQDVSTHSEDDDIAVRTRERFTPGIPDRKTVAKNMAATHNQADLESTLTVLQTYHEVMQSAPDMAKTYLLGQIRMLGAWTQKEEARLDLKEGTTPLDWAREVLLPSIIADMSELEGYFDMDHDMYFYRQWQSEALRVMRDMDNKLEEQALLRQTQDDDQALTDLLFSIPSGSLVEWSMDNPEQAELLLDDENHRERYTERLIEELFSDAGVIAFLAQLDALVLPEDIGEEREEDGNEILAQIREALLEMDVSRLAAMSVLPEMEDFAALIQASIEAIAGLNVRLHGIIQEIVGQYGAIGGALEAAIRDNPTPMVQSVVHGGHSLAPPAAVQRIDEPGAGGGYIPKADEEEEVEEEPEGDPDEDPEDEDTP